MAIRLPTSRLVAFVHAENTTPVCVAEKPGFRFERKLERPDGRRLQLFARES